MTFLKKIKLLSFLVLLQVLILSCSVSDSSQKNTNEGTFETNYALASAVMNNDQAGVDDAIKSGASVDYIYNDYTMLMLAIEYDVYDDIILKLIRNKADIGKRNMRGYNALMMSVVTNDIGRFKLLMIMSHDILDLQNVEGETALHLACQLGDNGAEFVSILLSRGADYKIRDRLNNSAYDYIISDETRKLFNERGIFN